MLALSADGLVVSGTGDNICTVDAPQSISIAYSPRGPVTPHLTRPGDL